jgi:pimeloyl-ACP methyl ester carboxylesterase
MARLVRDGVTLAYEESGRGDPPLVLVHGLACNRGFWPSQVEHFAARNRVIAVDLRGHGESDAPEQRYPMQALADDLAWTCEQLGAIQPVLVGHSLGGLVSLELAAARPDFVRGVAMIDSVLVPGRDRAALVHEGVAGLRGSGPERTLRDYYGTFFGPYDDPELAAWILGQVVRTPPHVTASVWEESLESWSDAGALARATVPLAYLDAGSPNANLARAVALHPAMIIGRTIGSGHFSPLAAADQVNAMLERFLAIVANSGE